MEIADQHIGAETSAHSELTGNIFSDGVAADIVAGFEPPYLGRRAPVTAIIDHRLLMRECLHRGLLGARMKGSVEVFVSVEDLLAAELVAAQATLIVLSMGERSARELKKDWARIVAVLGRGVPVVLLADEEKASFIIEALDDGIRGYIPTSMPLGVAVEAMELVRAGGTFIPACSFLQGSKTPANEDRGAARAQFTGRQAEVVTELRKGTSNKVIAYNLKMAESTVKVHVRNIMRKVNARNRTHVAFLLNQQDSVHW